MPINMRSINEFTQQNIWISRCDGYMCKHAPKAPCAVWAQYTECTRHFQYTPRIYSQANQRTQNEVGVYEFQFMCEQQRCRQDAGMHVKMRYDLTFILTVRSSLYLYSLYLHSKITMAGDVVPYYTVTAEIPTPNKLCCFFEVAPMLPWSTHAGTPTE